MNGDRSSEANQPTLITDPIQIARLEAENTLRQFDLSMVELGRWLAEPSYRLRVSTILKLNRVALTGVSAFAGTFRPDTISITGSGHVPPDANDVPSLVEDFCDYVSVHWETRSAIHLAAYALWRLNWIHPFVDGNGRTARAVSYLILCAKLGYRLPGTRTIPEQIAANKKPYYVALELGDKADAQSRVDVSALEEMLDQQLARQLADIHKAATGESSVRAAVAVIGTRPISLAADPPARGARTPLLQHIEKHPVVYGGVFAIIVTILGLLFGR